MDPIEPTEPAERRGSLHPVGSADSVASRRPRVRCVVLGGGPYVLRLIALMARERALPALDWVLVATRPGPLSAVAHRARLDLRDTHPEWTVIETLDPDVAIEGADAIVVLVRVGGLTARGWDETFPARHGLAGDEGIGVGGMANAWRTLPVIDDLARRIHERAPLAFVFNLTAPLGITTRAFLDHGLATLGVCELPRTTLTQLSGTRVGSGPGPLDYGGLNHLGWFWPRNEAGRMLLQNAVGRGLVDHATYERFGAAPLSYYYEVYDLDSGERLGHPRRPGRARRLEEMREGILQALREHPASVVERMDERPTPWFEHALVPLLAAAFRGEPHETFGNIANQSSWAGLSEQVVVEHGVRYREGSIDALAPGAPPSPVAEFLARVAASERLTYEAARQRDRDVLAQAIAAQPLPIRSEQIPAILADLVAAPGATRPS